MCIFAVTPLAGVWIEIMYYRTICNCSFVTPLAGVWIEIVIFLGFANSYDVTPLAGVWIEIYTLAKVSSVMPSLPLRECGLK